METKVKFKDNRKNTNPTFEDIEVGSMFTETDSERVYIKLEDIQIQYCGERAKTVYHADSMIYNAMDIQDGEFVSFDDDEEIYPIQEIEITIKR